jgi:hypothetical protein
MLEKGGSGMVLPFHHQAPLMLKHMMAMSGLFGRMQARRKKNLGDALYLKVHLRMKSR